MECTIVERPHRNSDQNTARKPNSALTSGMHFENDAGICFLNLVLALISDGRFMVLAEIIADYEAVL